MFITALSSGSGVRHNRTESLPYKTFPCLLATLLSIISPPVICVLRFGANEC